jgi:hypothetical protein
VSRHRQVLLVCGLAVPFAELGHFLAYGLRTPRGAAHSYFPTVLHAAGAVTGAGALGALGVLVLARVVMGAVPRRKPWSFALLFSGLLFAQVAVFLVQEGLEARALPSPATLAVGLLGQQPVALFAAVALRWLSARLGPALRSLARLGRPDLPLLAPAPGRGPAFAAVTYRPASPRPTRGQRAPPASLLR